MTDNFSFYIPKDPKLPENLSHKKSRAYDDYLSLKDTSGKPIEWPQKTETLSNCLERFGYKQFEGFITEIHRKKMKKYLKENNGNLIVQVGFNAGHSAEFFLTNSDASVYSFDIGLHPYSWVGNLYLENRYPERHVLILGDSGKSIPTFASFNKQLSQQADFIFIDGDHSYERAYADMFNCYFFANPNTILVIDNVIPHRGVGRQVYAAFKELYENDFFIFLDHFEINKNKGVQKYVDGFVICKYRFSDSEKNVDEKVPNWAHMERKIPLYDITEKISEATTNEQLDEYKKQLDELKSKGEDLVDEYAYKAINDRKNLLRTGKTKEDRYKEKQEKSEEYKQSIKSERSEERKGTIAPRGRGTSAPRGPPSRGYIPRGSSAPRGPPSRGTPVSRGSSIPRGVRLPPRSKTVSLPQSE